MHNNIYHIFFDLDKTLWDFETNSSQTLEELYQKFELKSKGITSLDEMIDIYLKINKRYWTLYTANKISKEDLRTQRFNETFEYFGVFNKELAFNFGLEYIEISPKKKALYPFAHQILEYLHAKYKLHIITNGFEEVQYTKLKSANIIHFFNEIITSEKAGVKKPEIGIYEYALKQVGAKKENTIMIGDDWEADILGAINAGIAPVYFNPKNNSKNDYNVKQISCLSHLKTFL
jgi:putative hydrolase of the HAD superfamily